MANYVVLKDELDTDPLGRGYSGMSDSAAATDLNTVYRTRQIPRIPGADAYEQIDNAEFLALTASQQQEVWDIIHLTGEGEGIDVQSSSKARTRFVALFGGGSTTITDLLAAITENISRGVELGLGSVRESDVFKARAI
jgi:hypothetical protein